MATVEEETPIWGEIERAESYLVCCMFDEARSLASSIIKRLLENYDGTSKGCEALEESENEWEDMLESAGLVVVQSMSQFQRNSEILNELKLLFGSLTAIPVRVFLIGICFLMSKSPSSTVQGFLEEFLNSWKYADDKYYPISCPEASVDETERSCSRFSIGVDDYLEVVELYVITHLAKTEKDTDRAISWVEKAMLPKEMRQDLLRRLQSMNSSIVTSSSQIPVSPQLSDEYTSNQKTYNGHQKETESKYISSGGNTTKEEILKLARQKGSCFWWFPTIRLKLGNTRIVIPSGRILLASLLLLVYYFTRKKHAAFKSVLAKKALSVKKAMVDLWQLAFSYQVNPLAAIDTLPTATRGNLL